MDWRLYIHSDPDILLGKPVIKGTRISVAFLLERLADGWSSDTILECYPYLTHLHLQAVFAYLHDCAKDGLIVELRNRKAL